MSSMAKLKSIEGCFAEIEQVVDDLEGGDLPLEQAFKRYEAGLKHLQAARKQLDAYDARLKELQDDAVSDKDTEEDVL